jgi:Protein of unknown function (DUF2510)
MSGPCAVLRCRRAIGVFVSPADPRVSSACRYAQWLVIVWEYSYVAANTNNVSGLLDALNERGMAGWEVVGFASADKTLGLNALIAIVKRPRHSLASPPEGTEEGWLPDPSGRHPDRYWNGRHWTQWVRDKPGGTRSEDPPYGAGEVPDSYLRSPGS